MTLFMVVPAMIQSTIPMAMTILMVAMVTTTSRPAPVMIPLSAAEAMTPSLTILAAMKLLSTILVTVMIQSIIMVPMTVIPFNLAIL